MPPQDAGQARIRLARSGEMHVGPVACPFSVQRAMKLMQKIHTLTDN
jgi:hypothetical protein